MLEWTLEADSFGNKWITWTGSSVSVTHILRAEFKVEGQGCNEGTSTTSGGRPGAPVTFLSHSSSRWAFLSPELFVPTELGVRE